MTLVLVSQAHSPTPVSPPSLLARMPEAFHLVWPAAAGLLGPTLGRQFWDHLRLWLRQFLDHLRWPRRERKRLQAAWVWSGQLSSPYEQPCASDSSSSQRSSVGPRRAYYGFCDAPAAPSAPATICSAIVLDDTGGPKVRSAPATRCQPSPRARSGSSL